MRSLANLVIEADRQESGHTTGRTTIDWVIRPHIVMRHRVATRLKVSTCIPRHVL